MSEKVTTMVLKVDLECHRCYKKVKKLLGKFSEIGDQVYDEKANTVTIKVLSSNPEKLRDKIRSKGGKSVVSIEIKEPEKKKKEAEGKKKEAEKKEAEGKKKEAEKKEAEGKKEAEKPKTEEKKDGSKPAKVAEKEPEKGNAGGSPKEGPSPPKGPPPFVVAGYPPSFSIGAPFPAVYGRVGPAPGQNGEYIGRPIYDSYGGGRYYNYNASHCDYFSEENPSACVVM